MMFWSSAGGHLFTLGHVLQEGLGGPVIPLSEFVDVHETWDGLRLPHSKPPLREEGVLGEVAVHDLLRDPVLFPDANGLDLPLANEVSNRVAGELESLRQVHVEQGLMLILGINAYHGDVSAVLVREGEKAGRRGGGEAGRRQTHLPGDGRGDAPGEDGSRSLPLTLLY